MVITKLRSRVIEARIINGPKANKVAFIPRITLLSNGSDSPFHFKRRQFPVRLAFAMTINKSQGQTLDRVGIYLPSKLFTHGQLYVAMSRATSRSWLRILNDLSITDPTNVSNIVYREVLYG